MTTDLGLRGWLRSHYGSSSSMKYDHEYGLLYNEAILSDTYKHAVVFACINDTEPTESETVQRLARLVGDGMLAGLSFSQEAESNIESFVAKLCGRSNEDRTEKRLCLLQQETSQFKGSDAKLFDHVEIVTLGSATTSDTHAPTSSKSNNSALVLAAKITGALANIGYDAAAVAKVGRIVAKNTATVTEIVNPATADEDVPPRELTSSDDGIVQSVVQRMLQSLINPNLPSKKVHFNSNEPVLLINYPSAEEDTVIEVNEFVDTTISQLHHEHNIWPVRVYAGHFLNTTNQNEFSISLLNVSNTEVGGPSMIQLFDHWCAAEGWNEVARKEVWNNQELLSKDIRTPGKLARDNRTKWRDSGIELSTTDELTTAQTESPSDALDETRDAILPQPQFSSSAEAVPVFTTDTTQSHEDDETEEDVDSEAMSEVSPQLAPQPPAPIRSPINYPTFEHSTQYESLLDLVMRQAGRTQVSRGAEEEEREIVDGAVDVQSKTESEDEEEQGAGPTVKKVDLLDEEAREAVQRTPVSSVGGESTPESSDGVDEGFEIVSLP